MPAGLSDPSRSRFAVHTAPSDEIGVNPGVVPDEQHLLRAFRTFAETAGSLERFYSELRAEVARLRYELEESHAGLARSLEENRCMRQHLDRILESLPCGVVVVSSAGEITHLNPEGKRLLGLEESTQSSAWPNLLSDLRRELHELFYEPDPAMAGRSGRFAWRPVWRDGWRCDGQPWRKTVSLLRFSSSRT